ncbi:MAG: FAD binding domain-containing protein [Chloroflexota bacterium]
MKLWSRYHVAHSVEEAIDLLAQYAGRAQIVAGGTDLLLDIQQGNHAPVEALIDITRIDALTAIEIDGDDVLLGAGVTHTAIVAHPTIRSRATCLAESCGVVGGPQVRNVATIGGNVAHALPAADGTLSLVALEAQAEVASVGRREWHKIGDLFLGPGKSQVDATRQLLTQFRFKLSQPGEASAFKRIMRPQGVALPILGCAVWVKLDPSNTCFEDVSICVGPVGPTPVRATEIEALLRGQPADNAEITEAALVARDHLKPRASKYRATAEYRTEMIDLLIRQSLLLAVSRARTGEAVPQNVE